jgi:hypothetical protein
MKLRELLLAPPDPSRLLSASYSSGHAGRTKARGATTAAPLESSDRLLALENCAAVLPGLQRRNDMSLRVGFKPVMMTRTGIVEHFATGIGEWHRFLGLTPPELDGFPGG